MRSIQKITKEYINRHPSIKDCLVKGLINYSSLARQISSEEKIVSKAAVLIAARRYKEGVELEKGREERIIELLRNAEIEVKNKVFVLVVEKRLSERLLELEREIKKGHGIFYLIEGSMTMTIVSSERHLKEISKAFRSSIIRTNKNLVMIIVKSGPEIETLPGVVSFIYSLFADRGINIMETMSCWTDTIIIIDENDLAAAMQTLKF